MGNRISMFFRTMPLVLLTVLAAVSSLAHAQAPVQYTVSFANGVHHEAKITVVFDEVSDPTLQLRMSRSSPGRYALHEFAKNVYNVQALDRQGNSLPITRPNPYQWDVSGHNGYVRLDYTLFADRADGTYAQIDNTHAHLNMPAAFMWARGLELRPIRIEFTDYNPDWNIATQLVATGQESLFTAPDLQYFMDSPTEISAFSLREFPVSHNGSQYTIRLAVHHDAHDDDVDELAAGAEAVVKEHMAVYGEYPDYDHGSYTFIADYLPHVNGDGMEHRNSTILTSSRSLRENAAAALGTLSHEFFHSWNVERIRPRTLQPFDFEQANMSRELWLAEGFTQYYGNLLLHRAGQRSEEENRTTLQQLVNGITFTPARDYFGPIGMSMQAPFTDAATALDPTNFANIFFSYYNYGAALALALDLQLRQDFDSDLDAYMHLLWTTYGKTEIPYTVADLEQSLAELTNDGAFASDFFQRFIYGSELPDYRGLLANAGYAVTVAEPDTASLGNIELEFADRRATISSPVRVGTPLYAAGLNRGDQIVRIGRRRMSSERAWERMLRRADPGQSATIEFIQRGESRSAELHFAASQRLLISPVEEPSTAQIAFRDAWLQSKVQ
ncbi:MAG: M61 family peptidase [Gammaproteobacteria bacterium]|nr:M61 family metallopeptidase [Pseudomonadales bacterium]